MTKEEEIRYQINNVYVELEAAKRTVMMTPAEHCGKLSRQVLLRMLDITANVLANLQRYIENPTR
jgi:hypothetical protein